MMRTGIAFAAGGERLVAWHAGILAGCVEADGDALACTGAIVGTSAGTVAAVQLARRADPAAWAAELARRAAGRRAEAGRIDRGRAAGGAAAGGAAAVAAPAARTGARAATIDAGALFGKLAADYAAAPGTPQERRRALGRAAVATSPGGEEAFVASVRRRLPAGAGWPAGLRVAALDADSGERVVFDSADGVPLERALAATRSVPLLRPPVTVAGRRCIDGALASATNADLLLGSGAAAPPDLAIVVTGSPADAAPRSLDAHWNAALADELRTLRAAGVAAHVLRATDADRAAMGPDPLSSERAVHALAAGRARGAELAAALVQRTRTIAGR